MDTKTSKSLITKPKKKEEENNPFANQVQPEESQVQPTVDGSKVSPEEELQQMMSPLVARIKGNLEEAENARINVEAQWLKNIKAYRAEDDISGDKNQGQSLFRESEIHKPYIRTTTVKTRAAYSQIMESLMQNSRFPLMIEPTPVPDGVPSVVTNAPGNQSGPEEGQEVPEGPSQGDSQEDFGLGFEGDGRELEPGSGMDSLSWKKSDPLYASMNEGHDKSDGTQFSQMSPSGRAAEQMTKVILDQLEESNAHKELRSSVFEACLLGTGIMKGVFTEKKVLPKWTEGKYTPETKKFPKIHAISCWDLYIDPNAMQFDDAEWVIERHRMTAKQLRDLKARELFKADVIDKCIVSGSNYVDRRFEFEVREKDVSMNKGRLWEVLEYWGYMSSEEAHEHGLVDFVDDITGQVQVNLWLCGSEILRVMVNPFLPKRLPYFLMNYEQNPYNLYGIGVPETMEDAQKMMNGFARLAVDNLALAGNVILDVDETMLVPGQDMSVHPGKIFRRQGGQPGAAVHAIKFPSTANENIQMMEQFRRQADEATGIPSVSHGQTGVSGTGRTASGLNMILENASLNIKTVLRNIDDDMLQPMGKMLFYWNQQFNSENIPKGDLEVIATGIRSFTKNEIKVQRISGLLQLAANPAIAPMIKMSYLVREYVKGLDMDPNEAINDMDEAKIYAQLIGTAGGAQGAAGATEGAPVPQGPPGTSNATANTEGAGNAEGV